MAAQSIVRVVVECGGLGPGIDAFTEKFTDTNTPDDFRKVHTVISSTALLLSSIVNVQCSEILGLGIRARAGDVYLNTISTAISTAGSFVSDGQSEFMTFSPGNSCVIALKGTDADTAITILYYSALTV